MATRVDSPENIMRDDALTRARERINAGEVATLSETGACSTCQAQHSKKALFCKGCGSVFNPEQNFPELVKRAA